MFAVSHIGNKILIYSKVFQNQLIIYSNLFCLNTPSYTSLVEPNKTEPKVSSNFDDQKDFKGFFFL